MDHSKCYPNFPSNPEANAYIVTDDSICYDEVSHQPHSIQQTDDIRVTVGEFIHS